jgi:hypothetical protein
MNGMMSGMGWGMLVWTVVGLLVIALLVVAIVKLVKKG